MALVHMVELLSLVVLAVFGVLEVRRGTWRESLGLGACLMAAAWLGEETCIRWYGFYEYSADWHLMVDKMPLGVALIWPFVVLSDERVVGALGFTRISSRILATALLVTFDASLMEPVAVQAGLWHWNEPGLFGVPVIGILGWGFFTGAALTCWYGLRGKARVLTVILAPAGTHVLLLAAWWGGLRYVLRGPLPAWGLVAGLAALSLLLSAWIVRHRLSVPWEVMVPRMGAASLFAGVLLLGGRDQPALLAWFACFSPPYVLALPLWGRGSARRAEPRG